MRSLTGRWSLVADIWTVSWRDTPATTTPTGRIGGSPFVRLSSVGPIHRLPYRARSPADKSWPGSTSTWRRELAAGEAVFTIARNPQEDTKLPYLLRLPIEGCLVLKARDTWPRAARIYCHAFEEDWPEARGLVADPTAALSADSRAAESEKSRLRRSVFDVRAGISVTSAKARADWRPASSPGFDGPTLGGSVHSCGRHPRAGHSQGSLCGKAVHDSAFAGPADVRASCESYPSVQDATLSQVASKGSHRRIWAGTGACKRAGTCQHSKTTGGLTPDRGKLTYDLSLPPAQMPGRFPDPSKRGL
jgi:hypothetical protein